jgi:CRISPR system Cascade subunit CasE
MAGFPQAKDSHQARKEFEVLYRLEIERETQKFVVLVQSKIKPDWRKLDPSYFDPREHRPNPDMRSLDEFLVSIKPNSLFRFRYRANPTKRRLDRSNQDLLNHKRVGLYKEQEQLQWLGKKANSNGFAIINSSVIKDVPLAYITENEFISGYRPMDTSESDTSNQTTAIVQNRAKNQKISFYGILFEGQLKVIDVAKFKDVLINGLGHGKAYGFGLISLAPIGIQH